MFMIAPLFFLPNALDQRCFPVAVFAAGKHPLDLFVSSGPYFTTSGRMHNGLQARGVRLQRQRDVCFERALTFDQYLI